jgi:nitrogen fixation/metabolism regulation signal transduction histidine kinase
MMGARGRSVRTEIVAGFAMVILAFGAVAAYSLVQQARAVSSMRLANEGYLRLAVQLGEVRVNQGLLNTLLDRLLDERDRANSRTWLALARRSRRGYVSAALTLVRESAASVGDPEDRALLDRAARVLHEIDRSYADDEPLFDALFQSLASGSPERPAELKREVLARESTCELALNRLTRDLQRRIQRLADEAERRQRQSLRLTVLAIAVACVLGALSALTALRALRPLTQLRARARAVARGDLTPVEINARPDEIGELAGEFERMVGAVGARDAALREANDDIRATERHLELVVATLRAAVMVVRSDGVVATANAAALRYAERSLEGHAFADTLFGRDLRVRDAAHDVSQGAATRTFESVALGERVFDLAVARFAEGDDTPGGALVVADDVTERESARSRLLQAERLAAIGRMAAHVTHEVRNPLSSMALNAEMLSDEVAALGEGARESSRLVHAIQREIDRLTGITEEYLRVARLPRPRLERDDLGALVSEATNFVAREMNAAGVQLTLSVADDLPAVMFDEAQVRQAILNLLRNAREAMESAQVSARRIVVRVRRGDEGRGGVVLEVCDAGVGLADEAIAHLFELFYTTKERGTGLGLPLTREIIVAHGGSIHADRAPAEDGGGARFTIWLPGATRTASSDTLNEGSH